MDQRLSLRAVNRATLQRQLLLERSTMSPLDVLARVAGMQAQDPNPPYYGLWARIEGFTQQDLIGLVNSREVVRIALMRSTIHLVTAQDCRNWRPLLQIVSERGFAGNWGKKLNGADVTAIVKAGRKLVEAQPLTFAELAVELSTQFPGLDPPSMAQAVRAFVALVQVPPRGLWGSSGQARHTSAELWLGKKLPAKPSIQDMFLRYLAAFGPASVKDAQVWSGLTRLREVAESLKLRRYTGPDGTELLDLPDAVHPDEDTPAPARFLAPFENMMLSYDDRSRIMNDDARKRIFTPNGIFPGVFTVDGFIAGSWKLSATKKAASLTVIPFGKLSKRDIKDLTGEAAKLLEFAAPGVAHELNL